MSDTAKRSASAHLGEHRLTTLHAVGQSLAIGPIFSAGLLTGLVAAVAGFSTPASVLLASIGALALGYVVSLYARRFAGAGAIYEYLTHAASPSVGVYSGGVYFMSMLLVQGSFAVLFGFFANGFWVNHISSSGAPPWWVFSLVYLVIVGAMNYFGVRLAIRGVLTLAALSAIPIVVLAVVIIAKGGAEGQSLAAFNPARGPLNSVFNGILFGVTLFIGFEASASIAEETRHPRRSIPIAVLSTIAISAVFYLLVVYAATIGFGAKGIGAWAGDPSPLGTLAHRYVGSSLATIVDLVIILDMLSAGIAFSVTGTRGIFALSRDGFLPRPLARTSRFGTPVGGTVVVLVAALAVVIWASVTNIGHSVGLPDEFQVVLIMVAAGSFLIELIYIFLALAAFRLVYDRRAGVGDWWRYVVVLIGLAVPVLAFKGALDPWPKYPNIGIYIALGVAAVAAVWFAVLWVTRREVIQNAASYATQEPGIGP